MYLLDNLYWKLYNAVMKKMAEEDGINTIEIVVILVGLVALALVFKDKIVELFNTWWAQIATSASPTP